MSFMIESEISKQYLREEDAVEGFREAVENGQVRLALQILVDIVDAFVDIFEAVTEGEDEEEKEVQQEVTKEVVAEKIEQEQPVEKIEPAPKKTVKQEKPDTQEV
jgi:Mg2+ and Co2+ transporter CorA